MKDHTQQEKPIQWLLANATQYTLGVYQAPDSNNKMQIQILLNKTWMWTDKACTRHLNKVAVWLNLTSTILRQVQKLKLLFSMLSHSNHAAFLSARSFTSNPDSHD